MSVGNREQMADKTNEFELLGFGGKSLPTPKAINKRKVSLNSLGSKFKEKKKLDQLFELFLLSVFLLLSLL